MTIQQISLLKKQNRLTIRRRRRSTRAFACLAGIMPAITRTLVFMKENRGLGKGRLSNQIKAAKEIEKIYRK